MSGRDGEGEALAGSALVKRSVLAFVGLTGAVASLTILFLCMRSVMDVGGVCGSGNTVSVPRVQCPTGVPGLMFGSIFGGLVFLALYATSAIGPNLVLFAWPALFLSLGWNFLEYGIDPPGGGGAEFGWLLCGVIFVLMGGVPLVIAIQAWRTGRASRLHGVDAARVRDTVKSAATKARSTAARVTGSGKPASVVDELGRLSTMHRNGEIDDDEYEAAKAKVLEEGGTSV
jgi:hypothetical protein